MLWQHHREIGWLEPANFSGTPSGRGVCHESINVGFMASLKQDLVQVSGAESKGIRTAEIESSVGCEQGYQ
ncbi:hypothetical protein [Methanonatronarchaeum sp. AMET6-2]|uniref:hypothetical protein n=1 Tax=Methanonatronarchaeum sp. AMET6-2 TaxID=2933293 RepID=UPI001FF18D0C|nr:hypothetical protein [Methanonatronarchaeum sp. AMET6-2]UOY09501.1 hypothetical protein MU439_04410 [Methanonatronarchaeum sp. AMET6-2]